MPPTPTPTPKHFASLMHRSHLPQPDCPTSDVPDHSNRTTDRVRAPEFRNPGPTISTMSPSALRKTGSTRAWRRLRQPWSDHLAAGGTLQCAAHRTPKCLGTITQSAELALGHTTNRSAGGNDRQLQPECRPCSDSQGGQLGHAAQNQQAPERKW